MEGAAGISEGGVKEGSPSMRMNMQAIDHYDFINAPQYVDFAELAQNDDPNADVFFETHREEDDFLISIENITPTVQLLTEQNNVLYMNENEVNQAVSQAGMEDVKVVYYSSPSDNKKKSTTGRKTTSLNSTTGSFHTPVGDFEDCETQDKENFPSPPKYLQTLNYNNKGHNVGGKGNETRKNSNNKVSNTWTRSPEVHDLSGGKGKSQEKDNHNIKEESSSRKSERLRDSLLSQLEKLTILSSDEEDAAVESIEGSFYSPTGTPVKTDESLIDSLLKTPGAYGPKAVQNIAGGGGAISLLKKDFFEGLAIDSPMQIIKIEPVDIDNEEVVENSSDSTFVSSVFPGFDKPLQDDENARQSFIVEPYCGQEMVWNQDEGHPLGSIELQGADLEFFGTHGGEVLQEKTTKSQEIDDYDDADNTLTSSFESYKVGQVEEFISAVESTAASAVSNGRNRRSSSCNDLTRLLISNSKSKKLKSHIPKLGLTIPHSPDATKHPPSKCRSHIKPSELSKVGIGAGGTSMKSSDVRGPKMKSTFVPSVPYKGAAGPRQPLKASHYVSLAEAISKFQKNTPDRFRTLPKGRVPVKRSSSVDTKSEKRTRSPSPAHSPKRFTACRSRAGSVSSQTTVESGGEQKISHSYQAHGKVGGPVQQKKTTIPQPFKLSSAKPRNVLEAKTDVTDFKFKARPVPTNLLQGGPAGIKERPQAKVTQAMAPHFASDDRIRERNEKRAQSAAHSPTNSNAPTRPGTAQSSLYGGIRQSHIPVGRVSRAPVVVEPPKAPTVLKPFSFDQRDRQTLRRREDKMKQDLEEDKKIREFHAHPLPTSFTPKLPKKRPTPLTNVEPFKLKSDQRGVAYQEALKQKLDEEERRQKMMATFYANPPVVLHKPAFEPEHPARAPLESLDFQLNTEKRAVEREHFDQYLRQKEFDEEEKKLEEQERLEELERREELEKRRLIVHKAQPFRHPKQFAPKASEKALTIPQSPAFRPLPSQRRLTPTKNDNNNKTTNPGRGSSSSAEEFALILLFCTVFYLIALVDKIPHRFHQLFYRNRKEEK